MDIVSLKLQNLSCIRNGSIVFRNLNYELSHGDALIIKGHNGSGKSTLLKMLAGFLQPSKGDILYNGISFYSTAEYKNFLLSINYIADSNEQNALEMELTCQEHLNIWLRIHKLSQYERAAESISLFELSELMRQKVKYLSYGQKRRLSLLRLMIFRCKLWLLDEPLNGLDYNSCNIIKKAIYNHLQNEGMAIIATHRVDEFTEQPWLKL